MKRHLALPAAFAAVLLTATPALAFGDPEPYLYVIRNDRVTLCATAIQGWAEVPVQANDVDPVDTRITDTDQPPPAHGAARIRVEADRNVLEFRNLEGPHGTDWLTYEVHYPNGRVAIAEWRVDVDRFC